MVIQTSPRRRGPMSPEDMIDLRNQELQVDEEMVRPCSTKLRPYPTTSPR